jgi:uncharacterized protein (TIGR00725 family)
MRHGCTMTTSGKGTAPVLGTATVGVMGSSEHEQATLAEPLGALLARLEVNLLTGAGSGVMTAVSRAYLRARRGRGVSIGIVPCASREIRNQPRAGYPNAFVELAIHTHLPVSGGQGLDDLSRNHINILSSNAIVALRGSAGTISEVELALRYARPVIGFASHARELAHFPGGLRRSYDLDEVEAFLRPFIGASERETEPLLGR